LRRRSSDIVLDKFHIDKTDVWYQQTQSSFGDR
jgi:hypothetical protein